MLVDKHNLFNACTKIARYMLRELHVDSQIVIYEVDRLNINKQKKRKKKETN